MSDFFSLSTKGQGRIDHFCSVISLGQSFHFAGVGRVNHTLRWPYDQGFHNVPKFPFYGVGVPSSTSNEQDALVLSLLCQCPRIFYHSVWNELKKWLWRYLLWQILLRREICTCLELASHFERALGNEYKGQHIRVDYCWNYLPKTSARLWSIQERCENEPQLSLPAKWSPWAVNLDGTIYLHYLCTQVVWSLQIG